MKMLFHHEDDLPIRLCSGVSNPSLPQDVKPIAISTDYSEYKSGDIVFTVTQTQGTVNVKNRQCVGDPYVIVNDNVTKSTTTMVYCTRTLKSYKFVRRVTEQGCVNLDPYQRCVEQYNLKGPYGHIPLNTTNTPYAEYVLVKERCYSYLHTKRYPCYFTVNGNGHLLIKELATNIVHVFDRDLNETVITVPSLLPTANLLCASNDKNTWFQMSLISTNMSPTYDEQHERGQDSDANILDHDPSYYCEIVTPVTDNNGLIPTSLGGRSEDCGGSEGEVQIQYTDDDLVTCMYDFNFVMWQLGHPYSEQQLLSLLSDLKQFLEPREIIWELLYIMGSKLVDKRQDLLQFIVDKQHQSCQYDYDKLMYNLQHNRNHEWECYKQQYMQRVNAKQHNRHLTSSVNPDHQDNKHNLQLLTSEIVDDNITDDDDDDDDHDDDEQHCTSNMLVCESNDSSDSSSDSQNVSKENVSLEEWDSTQPNVDDHNLKHCDLCLRHITLSTGNHVNINIKNAIPSECWGIMFTSCTTHNIGFTAVLPVHGGINVKLNCVIDTKQQTCHYSRCDWNNNNCKDAYSLLI